MNYLNTTAMMKRHAILIESSRVRGEEALPGAVKDIQNWRAFLMSDLGGAWDEGEITTLSMPKSAEVARLVKAHSDGYVFFAFSGHGCERINEDRTTTKMACLNDDEKDVPIETISPEHFATTVFDCCRGLDFSGIKTGAVTESYVMDSWAASCKNSSQDFTRQQLRQTRKSAFLGKLYSGSESQMLRMYACSQGEGARDNGAVGGFYTTLLIAGAKEWEAREAWRHQDPIFYTTREAHTYAEQNMSSAGSSQHPEYTPISVNYPFAVR